MMVLVQIEKTPGTCHDHIDASRKKEELMANVDALT